MIRTVRPGHAEAQVGNLRFLVARRLGPRRPATAIAQALPTAAVRTSRRNALAETRHPPTTTAAIRSRALTIRRPRARIRRRELIPRPAVAIRRLRAPTPRPAAAIAAEVEAAIVVPVEVAAAAVVEVHTAVEVAEAHTAVEVVEVHIAVEVVEVHTAVEAQALTATTNLFARHKRPAR